MPSGEQLRRGPAARRRPRGFTYLGVLLVAALGSALAAGLLQRSSQAEQRERERELLFRGAQIRAAIEAYRAAAEPAQWPSTPDDLLSDRRLQPPRHHLRRLYADPFTGQADWVWLSAPGGEAGSGLTGVHSRSSRRRLLKLDGPPDARGDTVAGWQFVARAQPASAPVAERLGDGPAAQPAAQPAAPPASGAGAATRGFVTSW